MNFGQQGASCEVCGGTGRGLVEIHLEVRIVTLCRRHAARAREANVRTFSDLRRLFVESGGNRSLLPRRGEDPRRQLPPRPEGRRLKAYGRRKDDSPLKTEPSDPAKPKA